MRPIYLDNHSTTPCDPAVVDAMLPYFTEKFGNAASRTHTYGFEAKAATEHGRGQVAALIGASPKEIVFTSGATEADDLAVIGFARQNRSQGRHVVMSAIEHKAVLDSGKQLEREGFEVTVVSPGSDGVVGVDVVRDALRDDTILVSLMLANNEIGTVQPVAEVASLCRERGVFVHTDAVQALGRLPIDVGELGVDMLSLSAHKMYGPKGVGALFVRRGRPRVQVEPIIHGGGHERGMRSGTLPVPLIVGFGKAAELAREDLAAGRIAEVRRLRDRLWTGLSEKVDGVHLNGSWEQRLPNNLNISIERVEGEALLMGIRREVACSSGSACTSATLEPSYVLRAIGVRDELAHSSIRFGVGRFNTEAEVDRAVEVVALKVEELRAMSPMYGE